MGEYCPRDESPCRALHLDGTLFYPLKWLECLVRRMDELTFEERKKFAEDVDMDSPEYEELRADIMENFGDGLDDDEATEDVLLGMLVDYQFATLKSMATIDILLETIATLAFTLVVIGLAVLVIAGSASKPNWRYVAIGVGAFIIGMFSMQLVDKPISKIVSGLRR